MAVEVTVKTQRVEVIDKHSTTYAGIQGIQGPKGESASFHSGNYATTGNLAATGNYLLESINIISGQTHTGFALQVSLEQASGELRAAIEANVPTGFVNSGEFISAISTIDNQINILSGEISNTSGGAISFIETLNSGVDIQYVPYPFVLSQTPEGVHCQIQNNIDDFIYSFVIKGVNTSGFHIVFSDYLSEAGYKLHTTLNF